MLRLQTCTSLWLLLLIACGDGKGTTNSTDGASTSSTSSTSHGSSSSSDSHSSSGDGTVTTAPTTSSASTTDGVTTTTVADTGEVSTGETGDLPEGACRDSADCTGRFESCFAPGKQNCGDCQGPDNPCFDNDGCEDGLVCLPFEAPCACEPGGCGPDADCNVLSGACEPFNCSDDNILCPPHFDCVPGSGGDDCVRHPCSEDADCGGTPCVEGGCHEQFGVCMPPAP